MTNTILEVREERTSEGGHEEAEGARYQGADKLSLGALRILQKLIDLFHLLDVSFEILKRILEPNKHINK